MDEKTFANVWYRTTPVGGREVTMKAMEDRGELTVGPGKLVFTGKKKTVEITDIRSVTALRAGRDFINRWIVVTYGADGDEARFVDGRLLGWAGILGGNTRLRAAIEAAAAATS
jgi:hypothetical protein